MLLKVKKQNWDASFDFAPPLVDCVINTEDIVQAEATDSRGSGPFVKVWFRNGGSIIMQGSIDDLLK